ncbi:MAG: polysaccharide biosynthesis C-terminal domain-containing protein, partial [Chloroflexi bacterium]|nr:polysaccharide biosynthesis C-terminal domain-containing protein [Chloroflexota bacterium]
LSTVLKVSLGLLALLLGYGFVGLAFVSVAVNTVTMLVLYQLVRRLFFTPRLEFEAEFGKDILHTSYPLMINHLLASLFFRIDVTLLQPLKGNRVVGWYTAPYKILDGLLIIPSTFTFAIFPLMSRLARDAREGLVRAYHLSLKWLLIISLPLVLLIFNYAHGLILILGGPEFLPHSAIALQLLIWFLPLSFINGLTQYVLIAVNQQAFLTRAFLIVFSFNLITNLIFIPQFSYQASAVITVLSEVVLFLPFYYAVRKHITSVPWLEILWRPGVAVLGMAAALFFLGELNFLILIPLSLAVYAAILLGLGTLQAEEKRVIRSLVRRDPRLGI